MENFEFRQRPGKNALALVDDALSILLNELRARCQKELSPVMMKNLKKLHSTDAYLEVIGEDPTDKKPKYEFSLVAGQETERYEHPISLQRNQEICVAPEETAALLQTLQPAQAFALVHQTLHHHWKCVKALLHQGISRGKIFDERSFLQPRYSGLQRLARRTLQPKELE